MSTTPNLIRFLSQWDLGTSKTPTDNLLRVFSGEILTAYQDYLQFTDKVNYYTIPTGNSMQFPALWKIGSEYHEAGARVLGMDVETKQYLIDLEDRPLYTAAAFERLDGMLAHYQVRSQVVDQMSQELARQTDKKISILINKACSGVTESTATSFPNIFDWTGSSSTNRLINASIDDCETSFSATNVTSVANAFTAALTEIATVWDRNNIPMNDRYVAVTPAIFYALRTYGLPSFLAADQQLATVAARSPYPLMGHKDVTFVSGPNTVQGSGPDIMMEFLGFRIFRSNVTPWNTNITTGPSKWQSDFSSVYCLAFQKDCVGVLQKMGIAVEAWPDPDTKTDKISAMTYMGGGTLRPYCAVQIGAA